MKWNKFSDEIGVPFPANVAQPTKRGILGKVAKIYLWRYIPTKDDPADVASRSEPVTEEKQLWWRGPAWLSDPRAWPPDLVTVPTAESNAEASDKGSLSHSPIIRREVQCADAATMSVNACAHGCPGS